LDNGENKNENKTSGGSLLHKAAARGIGGPFKSFSLCGGNWKVKHGSRSVIIWAGILNGIYFNK